MAYEESSYCFNAYFSDIYGNPEDCLVNQMLEDEDSDYNRLYSQFTLEDADEYRYQKDESQIESKMTLGKRVYEELDFPNPTKVKGSIYSQSRPASVWKSDQDLDHDLNQSEIISQTDAPESQSLIIYPAPQLTSAAPRVKPLPQMRVSPNEKSDKTDLKMFSELTVKLLKKHGQQGLPKQEIEQHFKLELTQRALENMSDNYCLRRRLNLILTVLKCPQIGMIEECRDPNNKKIKIIKLTKKFLNDETCKLINSSEERAQALESKKLEIFALQEKLAKLQLIIQHNKQKVLNSVSIARTTPEGLMIFEQIADSSANRIPLTAPTITAETAQFSQIHKNTIVLSSATPIQLKTVADRLLGGF